VPDLYGYLHRTFFVAFRTRLGFARDRGSREPSDVKRRRLHNLMLDQGWVHFDCEVGRYLLNGNHKRDVRADISSVFRYFMSNEGKTVLGHDDVSHLIV
jgi:hypothetical protein